MNKLLITASIFLLLFACREKQGLQLDLLAGTWKRANKEQYEVWEKAGAQALKGYSYRMKAGEKVITETLTIRRVDGQLVYEATVPDQNEGRTIRFTLNPAVDSLLSFENAQHDFPKKIQYKKLDEHRLEVRVSGDNDEGFSYIQVRQ